MGTQNSQTEPSILPQEKKAKALGREWFQHQPWSQEQVGERVERGLWGESELKVHRSASPAAGGSGPSVF